MDRVAVIGITLNETDVAGLEGVARPEPDAVEAFQHELADALAVSELVFLATCNRVEVIFARESGHLPDRGDLDAALRVLKVGDDDPRRTHFVLRTGRAAARHLFRVSSSLESLVVGEDQILAQVREAYARSRAIGLVGNILASLFEGAFQVGKEVRSRTDLSRHPVSVVALGVSLLRERFHGDDLPPRIAVIGAGRTGRQVAHALADADLPAALVVNRTLDRAARLAAEMDARAVGLAEFRSGGEAVDAVVSATTAPGFVLAADELRRLARRTPSSRPLVALDLAVPRDLAPVEDPSLELLDLEDLRELARRNGALRGAAAVEAEALIEQKLDALAKRNAERRLAATLAEVVAESNEVFERQLRELSSGRLAHLGEEERLAVERWARTTFGRMAHVPLSTYKRLAHDVPDLFEPGEEETTG